MNYLTKALSTAAVLLGATVSAVAVTDTVFKYTTPQNGVLSISPMDFAPDGSSSASNSYFVSWSGNVLTGDGCFHTGATLPNGANIVSLRAAYSGGMDLYLVSTEFVTGNSTYLSSTNIPSDGTSDRKTTKVTLASPVKVSNGANMLGVGVCLSDGQSFQGVQISYTYTTAGD